MSDASKDTEGACIGSKTSPGTFAFAAGCQVFLNSFAVHVFKKSLKVRHFGSSSV